MSYQVTARKWRPIVFEDVVGQSHVTDTLRNAIKSNRVAHAYIFSGTRGCGKTTTARILARALNCLSPENYNPDNLCEVCLEITAGRSLDVIEIDGASNRGVEEIRNLRESVRYAPTRGKFKIYIIDEVHMLTKEAFNALLKTLEEPPAHVVFIFATTEVHKVPMTILSRCQRFDFRRIAIDEIMARVKLIAESEKVQIEDEALVIIAKKGDGSMRDAQSIFDQMRSYCGSAITTSDVQIALNVVNQELYFRVTDLIKLHEGKGAVHLVEELMKNGYDLREFVGGLAEHFRNLLVVQTTGSSKMLETSEPFKKRYQTESSSFAEQDVLRLLKQSNELEQSMRWAAQPRFKLEAALLQMVKMESSVHIADLMIRIEEMKKKFEGGMKISEAPSTSEVKVMGSVSAGTMQNSSVMSLSSFTKTQEQILTSFEPKRALLSQFHIPAAHPRVSTPVVSTATGTPKQGASYEQVVGGWDAFVAEVKKSRISLATSLVESKIVDAENGYVRISCADEYHLSTLKRNKEFLGESLQRILGTHVHLEPVLHANDGARIVEFRAAVISTISSTPKLHVSNGEHPLIEILKRELGAERID
jgi:DNA polymerase-3 subunit gamma/tau